MINPDEFNGNEFNLDGDKTSPDSSNSIPQPEPRSEEDILKAAKVIENRTEMTEEQLIQMKEIVDLQDKILYYTKGASINNSHSKLIQGFNYYKDDFVLPDKDKHGYTFITRPKLNMSIGNVKNDPILNFIATDNPNSPKWAMRCLLDPILSLKAKGTSSPLFDVSNPFIPILTNRVKSVSGFPDLVMETKEYEGGFFNENTGFVAGWDGLNKTYDLSFTFNDVKGGFILSLFLFWFRWMDSAYRGDLVPYEKYIEENKLCYTVSIYRFLMDETNTYITKWSKATGCVPVNIPLGAYFNYDKSQPDVLEGQNLNITFKCFGRIEYMEPIIFQDFNTLVGRYSPNAKLEKGDNGNVVIKNMKAVPADQMKQYNGNIIPFVNTYSGYNQLLWLTENESSNKVAIEDTDEYYRDVDVIQKELDRVNWVISYNDTKDTLENGGMF